MDIILYHIYRLKLKLISIFTLTYIWDFIKYMVERPTNEMSWREILTVPTTWAIIYLSLYFWNINWIFTLYSI